MNRKTLFIFAGVIGVYVCMSFLPQSVFAKEDDYSRHDKFKSERREKMKELFKELNLTDEQRAQMKQNRESFKGQNKGLRNEIKEKRIALKSELSKKTIDKSRIDDILDDLGQLNSQRIDSRVDRILLIKEALTPEQFQKFRERKQSWK